MFKINSISRFSSDTVKVSIDCNARAWAIAKKTGTLGTLYGIDVSNAVYQMHGVKASNPTVSDDKRASMTGVKSIDLYYVIPNGPRLSITLSACLTFLPLMPVLRLFEGMELVLRIV